MIDTETRIKNATTDLLLKDGNFGLSMADIAKRSEVSRTLLHYYFRSKEKLLSAVDKEIVKNIVTPKYSVLLLESSLISKIEKYIFESQSSSYFYPYLDVYFMSQYGNNIVFQEYFESIEDSYKRLLSQIQTCIDERKLNYPTPDCFLMELFSLANCSFIYSKFFTSSFNSGESILKPALIKNRENSILKYFFS